MGLDVLKVKEPAVNVSESPAKPNQGVPEATSGVRKVLAFHT